MKAARLVFLSALVTVAGCVEDPPPGVPSGGGPDVPGGGGGGGDAGLDAGPDVDGGAFPPRFCAALEPGAAATASFTAVLELAGTALEVDPAYLGVRWECDTRYLRVVIGPDPGCDDSAPGTLSLRFDRDRIATFAGSLPLPEGTADENADPLEIALVASPFGTVDTWGVCDATATGTLVLGMPLVEEANALWQLDELSVILPDCAAPIGAERVRVDASFDFLLPATYDQACR